MQDIEYPLLLLHIEVMLRHADIYQDIHLHLQFLLLNQADLQKFMSNCQKKRTIFLVNLEFLSRNLFFSMERSGLHVTNLKTVDNKIGLDLKFAIVKESSIFAALL